MALAAKRRRAKRAIYICNPHIRHTHYTHTHTHYTHTHTLYTHTTKTQTRNNNSPTTNVVFTLEGETGKSVSQHARAWLELVPVVRSWLMANGRLPRDKVRLRFGWLLRGAGGRVGG